jgi:hypothetical protein
MTHTPGPWRASEGWPSDVWHVDMPGRAYSIGVSRADNDDDMTVDEVQANARLIAAAPDLLAAAKLVLEAGDQEYVKFIVRDAISKAEGRE